MSGKKGAGREPRGCAHLYGGVNSEGKGPAGEMFAFRSGGGRGPYPLLRTGDRPRLQPSCTALLPFVLQLLLKPKFSGVEKIKTIGSTYMAAAGLSIPSGPENQVLSLPAGLAPQPQRRGEWAQPQANTVLSTIPPLRVRQRSSCLSLEGRFAGGVGTGGPSPGGESKGVLGSWTPCGGGLVGTALPSSGPPVAFMPWLAHGAPRVRVLWRQAGGATLPTAPRTALYPAGPGAAARPHRHHGGVQHRPDEQAGRHQSALLQLLSPPSW